MCSSIRSAASHSGAVVDACFAAEPVERLDERLAGDPVEGQRQRIDGGGDQIRADAGGDDRVEQPRAGRSLDEQPDRKARLLADPLDELLRQVGQERVGGVVDDDAGRTELGDLLRPLHECVDLADAAGAVHEPDVEFLARRGDRLARLPEIGDVVQRIVETEDVDPVPRRARDEPPDDVLGHGSGPDEKASAQGKAEGRGRPGIDRADALPRALDRPAHRRVEDAATRHLEVRKARTVEDLGDAEHLAGRQLARQRVLRQQADGGIDDLGHVEVGPYRGPRRQASALASHTGTAPGAVQAREM